MHEYDDLSDADIEAVALEMMEDDRIACERSYANFFKSAWEVIESDSSLLWNWHIDYLCSIMEEEVHRIGQKKPKTKDIIINICPRSLKTYITGTMLPAWAWIHYPSMKFIYASYSSELAIDASMACRRVIRSEWYQTLWGKRYKLNSDNDLKSYFSNNMGGHRLATSISATVVGRGGDFLCGDDLVNPQEVESELHRKSANDFWNKIFKTRLNNPNIGVRVMVMQRSHEEDTTGFVLSRSGDSYQHINIPATLEEEDLPSPAGLKEKYRKEGNKFYFFPDRFSNKILEEIRLSLGDYSYAGQYLQAPAPLEGGLFKRWYWNYWQPRGVRLPNVEVKDGSGKIVVKVPVDLPEHFDEKICSWDMTFKGTDGTDYVVGHKVGRLGASKYLLEEVRDRMEFPRAVEEVKSMRIGDNKISAVYVEDKANGSAVIAQLSSEIPGIVPVRPDISKAARAMPVVRQAEAGNIYLPHPSLMGFVDGFIEEHSNFPNAKHDDRVDAFSQAVSKLSEMKIRMINMFDKERKQHFRPFDIDFTKRTGYEKLYGTFFQEKNNRLSMVLAIWHGLDRHLYVFKEHSDINPVPEVFLPPIRTFIEKNGLGMREFNYWCNEIFEGKPEKPSTSHMYNLLDIYPQLNDSFERQASVLVLNQMFGKDMITINDSCVNLSNQLNEWYQEGNTREDILDFDKDKGLVMALCMLAGVLIHEKKIEAKPLKAYSSEKMDFNRRASDFVAGGSRPTGRSADAWMGV